MKFNPLDISNLGAVKRRWNAPTPKKWKIISNYCKGYVLGIIPLMGGIKTFVGSLPDLTVPTVISTMVTVAGIGLYAIFQVEE